jgi:hypothetical protein
MSYYSMVKGNARKFTGDESVMWASIEQVSDLLEDIKEPHPDIYWAFMRRAHELMYGKHFNKEYAEWEVEQMHHKSPDGKEHRGAHWTMEQTNTVYDKYRSRLPSEITPGDFYVALNTQYHDLGQWFMDRITDKEEAEGAIIESAVKFWFMDDDWPIATKVWCYFRMKQD